MRTRVYVVFDVGLDGAQTLVALRLTMEAARTIAKQQARRTVEPWYATKDNQLHPEEVYKQRPKELQYGTGRT